MKKLFAFIPVFLFIILSLSGCNALGNKTASLSLIYLILAVLSFLLLVGCHLLVKQKKFWILLLFTCVFVVNTGYTFLSMSSSLEMALMANRLAYLGSVFLPLSMLMIILNVTNTQYTKCLTVTLSVISIIVFLVAASPGILDIYYKEVSFEVVDGVSTLVKVYGPLHPLYFIYLLGYFSSMVAVILRSSIKKTIGSLIHAVVVALAVFVNIGIWFFEQIAKFDFEMLSVSYIISELFLLSVHLIMSENQRLKEIVKTAQTVQDFTPSDSLQSPVAVNPQKADTEQLEVFVKGIKRLTPTEQTIYEAYVARLTTKEIMANLNIKENTLKYHTKPIYGKLGVSSRKELLEVYKQIKATKEKYSGNTNINK